MREKDLIVLRAQAEHAQRKDAKQAARNEDRLRAIGINDAAKNRTEDPHQRELDREDPRNGRRVIRAEEGLLVLGVETPYTVDF